MDSKGKNIYKTITFSKKEVENDYDTVVAKFVAHFIPKKNITHEKAKFHTSA